MTEKLSQSLQDILAFLERPRHNLFPPATVAILLNRTKRLEEQIKAADDRLVIGLVGGTGVGKSTLINALAGQEISTRTDIRPTTRRLVLYRHRDNRFSLSPTEEVHLHDSDRLRRVSLVDFPDFDSLEPGHRQALAENFPKLDLLLWVVDPNKYGDQAFYDWLSLAPQAQANSLFVFNKIDEYQRRYQDRAAEVAEQVVQDLAKKIELFTDRPQPTILPISALEAVRDGGHDQPGFMALTSFITQLAAAKKRRAVKNLNLAAMTAQLSSDLMAAAGLEAAHAELTRLRNCLETGERDLIAASGIEAQRLVTIFRSSWLKSLTAIQRDRAPWPLDFFFFIWERLTTLITRKEVPRETDSDWPRPDLVGLHRRLISFQNEITDSWGPERTRSVQLVATGLAVTQPKKALADGVSALIHLRGKASIDLARRRWLGRHHFLPLLVLAYPFLPMMAAWLSPGLVVTEVSLGWRDILSLAITIFGLYLTEAIYYAFSQTRSAAKVLDELAQDWAAELQAIIRNDFITPTQNLVRDIEEEIVAVEKLSLGAEG